MAPQHIATLETVVPPGYLPLTETLEALEASDSTVERMVPGGGTTTCAPRQNAYAILSHDYWARRFCQDPTVIGRTFRVSDTLLEVIGVRNWCRRKPFVNGSYRYCSLL